MHIYKFLPVTLFAGTMGLGGLALVTGTLVDKFRLPVFGFELLRWLDALVLMVLVVNLLLRLKYDKAGLRQDYNHPVKLNFFAGLPISMFLLSALLSEFKLFCLSLYFGALLLITLFTLQVASLWFSRFLELKFLNPIWFIPIVGNVLAILTAQEHYGFLWYYFTVGCVFYILLLGMILFRLIFADPLPAALKPSLFIFLAPPSLCFVDYLKLTGEFDLPALMFLNLTIFFALLLITLWREFCHLPFTASWWAFTFPLATSCAAMLKAYEVTLQQPFLLAALCVYLLLVVMVVVTFYKTVLALRNGTLA
ncbi:MAG: hypothetical protein K6F05_02860 [Succinivibrio sp.]|nr:hypothetical protein [Succinivibrio sp.]